MGQGSAGSRSLRGERTKRLLNRVSSLARRTIVCVCRVPNHAVWNAVVPVATVVGRRRICGNRVIRARTVYRDRIRIAALVREAVVDQAGALQIREVAKSAA